MVAPFTPADRVRQISSILKIPIIIGLILTVLTVACAGSDGGDDDAVDTAMPAAAATSAGASAASEALQSVSGGAPTPAGGSDDAALQPAQGWQQRIIRTANMTLNVIDEDGGVSSALEAVRVLATSKGGYVYSSSSYVEQDREFAQITIQVPVEQFDTTMNDLRTASFVDEVVREESSTQDVTEEFVDNESRLNALRESERRFLALLGQAESIEDILRLENELTNVRSQIETIQGRQNYLGQVTSYSTIAVALQPAGVAVDPQTAGGDEFSLSSIAERAWENSRGAIEGILIATLTLAIVGAALVPVVGLVWLAYRLYRTRARAATS